MLRNLKENSEKLFLIERISSILSRKRKCLSLEVNSNQNVDLEKIVSLNPDFIAITWIGNFDNVFFNDIPPIKMAKELIGRNQNVLLHIPARNLNRKKALDFLNKIKEIGVRNILALKGQSTYIREKDDSKVDFPYARQFVRFIRDNYEDYFDIGVTGYPEKHRQSCNFEDEMKYLKGKVNEGANFILTQACFDIEACRNFHRKCLEYNINIPILLGTVVLNSFEQCEMLKNFCKISFNDEITNFIQSNKNDRNKIENFGKRKVLEIGSKFLSQTDFFNGIHIFSTQNLDLTVETLNELHELNRIIF